MPDEPPSDVLDLATTFGARLLVLTDPGHTHWPADIEAGADGAACFTPLDLGPPTEPGAEDLLADTTVYVIRCPESGT